MLKDVAIILVVVAIAAALFHPRVIRNRQWRATVTPLASIIGSGFLVLGPILDYSYGYLAPAVMAGLCAAAYLFGAAIRSNIARLDRQTWETGSPEARLEIFASWTLAFAYVISVAYYLNLFGAFAVSMFDTGQASDGRIVTSGVLIFLLITGWTRGFGALESLEQVSVSIKLAIICGLLVGLAWFFAGKAAARDLVQNPPPLGLWDGFVLALGLIITVQGFETSRYLSDEYDADTRISTMRRAQWISTAIYVLYIVLLSFLFPPEVLELSETAIIDLMRIVAPLLPMILIAGALTAQISAATADMTGSGGLLFELSKGRISPRAAYAGLVAIGLVLTWKANIFEIISYASRAFALYYAIQCAIAAFAAWRRDHVLPATILYSALALLGLAIFIFAVPAEGGN